MIERDRYLQQLKDKRGNGQIKVITGIRRCGKSYLLFEIYHQYLRSIGVDEEHIIELALDDDENIRYRNPLELGSYIRSLLVDEDKTYYIFLDEIQKVSEIRNPYLDGEEDKIGFVDVLLGLKKKKNADIYVTGSNSRMLSSDILTEFRGRGDEIYVHPLSFAEFASAYEGDMRDAWEEYCTYGGMPRILSLKDHQEKSRYLVSLFRDIYLKDILDRHKLRNPSLLDDLLDVLSSSIGSLTNPLKISNTFSSARHVKVSADALARYIEYFIDAFMLCKAQRYDVKGRKYIGSPMKYYYTDIGLRNARLNFRQTEETHIMENILYNELMIRGYAVDVGVVEYNYRAEDGKNKKTNLEIDFVASAGNRKYYIQSALSVGEEKKRMQEVRPYLRVADSFKKIVVVKDHIIPWRDEQGILYIGIERFLLDPDSLDY